MHYILLHRKYIKTLIGGSDMEILFRVLFFIAFGFMAMRMMRGGGCCGGGSHRTHGAHKNENNGGSCCSGSSKEDEELEKIN
tara:strand:+ start:73 stop:318 length:246 start_codon:yes stop_codon:yes gene_type:complete